MNEMDTQHEINRYRSAWAARPQRSPKRKALPMVYQMKRLLRSLMGVTDGISVHHRPARGEHFVRVSFASSAEADVFYTRLADLSPLRDETEAMSSFSSTGSIF